MNDLDALLGKALSGGLEPADREALERAFDADPGLADELARDARLGALLGIALEEEGRFERALRERHRAGREQAPFVDALRRRARRPAAVWMAGAAAASFLGLVFWAILRPEPPQPVPVAAPRPVTGTFRDQGRDATIYATRPDQNFGANGRLEAGGHGLAALLWWDLSEIPPGSRIESATLVLGEARNFGGGSSLLLFEAPRPWVEAQVTWRESARGLPWPRPGARFVTDRAIPFVGSLAPADGHRAAASLDASVVQRWIDAPDRNHGLLLSANAPMDWTAGFASREAHEPENHPALVVTWTPPMGK